MKPHAYRPEDLVKTAKGLSTALSERDSETQLHCHRVVAIALKLGRACAASSEQMRLLQLAAALHDIGKIGIPDRILRSRNPLDPQDWEIMKTHSARGQRIVAAMDVEGIDEVALLVRHHHEHYDGSGYPDGLAGEDIPLLSRILALADSYDAMATARSYRGAQTHAQIMQQLEREQGRKHDPDLFARLAQLLGGGESGAPR